MSNILFYGTAIATFATSGYLIIVQVPRFRRQFPIGQLRSIACLGIVGVFAVLITPGLLGLYHARFDIFSAIPVYLGMTGWMFFGNLLMATFRMKAPRMFFSPLPAEISNSDIIFQEWTATGHSKKNFITSIGGAGNCLRIVLTREYLWTTVNMPFGRQLASRYDLEHLVPLDRLQNIADTESPWGQRIEVSFTDSSGQPHTLSLMPDDLGGLKRALSRE
jgi:hypothetical protein